MRCAAHRLGFLRRLIAPLALCLAPALAATPAARAQDASGSAIPPNTVRVGLYDVFYHVSAHDLSGPFVPTGVKLDVRNVQTPYVAYVRHEWTHFDFELAFGVPPVTHTVGRGPAFLGSVPYNGQEIATVRWFSPSVVANYVFFDDSHALRPYLGVGINYTRFYQRNSTPAGNAASGGPTRLSLTASVGPVGVVGLSYRWAPRWSAYVSYDFSDIRTHLTANTAGFIRTTSVNFNPQTLIVSVGYSF